MKTMLKITRTELSSLFYSPIAWLLLIIFAVQSYSVLDGRFDMMLFNLFNKGNVDSMGSLTGSIMSGGPAALVNAMEKKLFLYIPLLTMGIFSRELASGSIMLLLSSPVKISHIVLGKFLAVVAYFSLLMLLMVAYMFVGGYAIEAMDYPLVLSGFLGFFLLICTYSAIGLFMSSLTKYQVVAAISSFAVLGFLSYILMLAKYIPSLMDVFYWFQLDGPRVSNMANGLITTKDIIYYVLITVMFFRRRK